MFRAERVTDLATLGLCVLYHFCRDLHSLNDAGLLGELSWDQKQTSGPGG